MQYVAEYNNFWELKEKSRSGAIDTLNDIESADLENAFMNLLEEIFIDRIPTDTEINDFIWFDRDYIYETLGLDENGDQSMNEDEIEEMKREQETDLIKAETFDDFCNDRCCELCLFGDCAMKCEDVFAEYKDGNMDVDDILE